MTSEPALYRNKFMAGNNQPPSQPPRPSQPPGSERRQHERIAVDWAVDYHSGDTFLYSYITNISAMGIFVFTKTPPAMGTQISVKFAPPGEEAFELKGEVAWINPYRPNGENPNPGMGIRFIDLDPDMRERLVQLVRTIAYLPDAKS